MAKIFDWDGRNGTLIDSVSKTAGTLTAGTGGFKKTEKGMAMEFDGSATKIDTNLAHADLDLTGDITIEVWVKAYSFGENNAGRITENGKLRFVVTTANNNFRLESDGSTQVTSADNSVILNKWQHILVSRNSAGDATNFYINSLLSGSADQDSGTPENGADNLFIGDRVSGSTAFDGNIARVVIHDKILTQAERNDLYKDFLHSYGTTEQKRNFTYPKPTDLSSEDGLVAAYNMIPQNGELVDISGNGNTGTISGALSTKDGMAFDGVDDSVALGNIGNIKSLSFRIKLATTTEQILEGAANDKLILANAGTLTYTDFDNAYINGVDSNTISAGLWHNVVITSTTDVDMSACTLALNNASYGAFEIEDLKFHSNELTPQQAKDYSNSFAKLTLRDSFSDTGADGIVKTPKGWM